MVDCRQAGSLARIPEMESEVTCCGVKSEKAAISSRMMDFSLFKDPIFMMYAVSIDQSRFSISFYLKTDLSDDYKQYRVI